MRRGCETFLEEGPRQTVGKVKSVRFCWGAYKAGEERIQRTVYTSDGDDELCYASILLLSVYRRDGFGRERHTIGLDHVDFFRYAVEARRSLDWRPILSRDVFRRRRALHGVCLLRSRHCGRMPS